MATLAALLSGPPLPSFGLALGALGLDAVLGDPVYGWHPVRLMGKAITRLENGLRRIGWEGYAGGVLLCLLMGGLALGIYAGLSSLLGSFFPAHHPGQKPLILWIFDFFVAYSLIALRDLIVHAFRVEAALRRGDISAARGAVAMLVGRDTNTLDASACRRAAVESLAENLCDGVIAPLFWLLLAGLPGLILFKVASTLDSMVGYLNERYRRFGWCGARLDDVLCWLPARLTFLLLVAAAFLQRGTSASKAWRIGRRQHGLLPGPNPGWGEATAAGALQVRLIGPIWKQGKIVTEIWIGDAGDRPGGEPGDIARMAALAFIATAVFLLLAALVQGIGRLG